MAISLGHRTVTIVSRISLIVADLAVIVTTWTWTYGIMATLGDQRGTISGVILFDGEAACPSSSSGEQTLTSV